MCKKDYAKGIALNDAFNSENDEKVAFRVFLENSENQQTSFPRESKPANPVKYSTTPR